LAYSGSILSQLKASETTLGTFFESSSPFVADQQVTSHQAFAASFPNSPDPGLLQCSSHQLIQLCHPEELFYFGKFRDVVSSCSEHGAEK
jgi:hypothetical protein